MARKIKSSMEAFSGSVGSKFQVYSDGEIWGTNRDKIYIKHKNIWGGGVFKILLLKNYSALIYGKTMQAYWLNIYSQLIVQNLTSRQCLCSRMGWRFDIKIHIESCLNLLKTCVATVCGILKLVTMQISRYNVNTVTSELKLELIMG